jgi:MerR family transcriptional regulator, Zn(II)-responsive regulator of zntA
MTVERLHKIGDVAGILATSIRAIRYYEEEGLLVPIRSEGGTRFYARRHIDRLKAILDLTGNGYSIEAIKVLAQMREQYGTGHESQKAVSNRLDQMLADIDARIRQLTALADGISATKNTVAKCADCQNQPSTKGCPECPVRRHLAEIELLNLVWDQEA